MTAIWKFRIPVEGAFEIDMPAGAKLLCVQVQRGLPFIWAEVNPNAELKPKRFRMFGTGRPMDIGDDWIDYVGSIQLDQDLFVFHLYEVDDDEVPF